MNLLILHWGWSRMALIDKLSAIASAVREKTGRTDAMTLEEMASAIREISSGISIDDIATNNIVGDITLGVSEVSAYSLQHKDKITSITGKNVKNIGTSALMSCANLNLVNFPMCVTVNNTAFQNSTKLSTISLPVCTSIGTSTFMYCSGLTSIDLPMCTNIGETAFKGFTKLNNIKLPACTTLNKEVFRDCSNLVTVDLPVCTSMKSYAFRNCSALVSLILRSTTVCTLAGATVFNSTPIASGTGYIYVPSALVETYKTASNWGNYTNQFRALEDYTVDGTTTGELDMSKI